MLSSRDYNQGQHLSLWDSGTSLNRDHLLFWSWYEPRNFGDWIGPFLFEAMTGHAPQFCPKQKIQQLGCVFSAGSILRHIAADDRVVVWGSGVISAEDEFPRPLQVLAVRGPVSRACMLQKGYECPETYGDPAILLPRYFTPRVPVARHSIGVVPHFVDLDFMRSRSPLHLVDPTRSVQDVINDIVSCRLILSSSLHGLIVAHAYGIPAIWIRPHNPIMGDDSKFRDYFLSVGLDPEPLSIADYSVNQVTALERYATLPDHAPLRGPLLSQCPFKPLSSAGE